MERNIALLKNQEFDIVIIGGGISGAYLAWEATLRGLKVALIEKNDFGHATSMATSKLIHGGLRYLAQYDFAVVRESLRERRYLAQTVGHLVFPLPFMLPIYDWTPTSKILLSAGLWLYDMLSFDKNHLRDSSKHQPNHVWLSKNEALAKEPGLDSQGLKGAFLYYDGLNNHPERFNIDIVKSAVKHGATVANYTMFQNFITENTNGRPTVKGIEALDLKTKKALKIKAKVTINASGPWGDLVLAKLHKNPIRKINRSKGIHILVPKINQENAITFETKDKKHFFIIPWNNHTLIGTTDTPFHGQPDELTVTEQDISEFMAVINKHYHHEIKRKDVLHSYAGIRPLVAEGESEATYKASRKHEIISHKVAENVEGLYSVFGGKYTTSRSLAEESVELIVKENQFNCLKSQSKTTQVSGGEIADSYENFLHKALEKWRRKFPENQLRHLIDYYGSEFEKYLELIETDKKLGDQVDPQYPTLWAEIEYPLQYEMAETLSDVLIRRCGLGNLGLKDMKILKKICGLMAKRKKWSIGETSKQIKNYLADIQVQP